MDSPLSFDQAPTSDPSVDSRAQKLLKQFHQVFVLEESMESEIGKRVLDLCPSAEILSDWKKTKSQSLSSHEIERGKKTLVVRRHSGHFFKRCPGSTQKTALTCCNYYVLNLGSQCNFDCSYCYLQSYLNQAEVQIFSNTDEALAELRAMMLQHPDLPYRVGTGEITDSLSLDPLTLNSRKLIQQFKDFPRWTLEFKTKSDEIMAFLKVPHSKNVVVSWSLNPAEVVQSEEHGTAPLEARLRAAELCVQQAYSVAFHLDPMIFFEGWETAYRELVQRIAHSFRPEQVSVISLGSLRIQPEQRHLQRQRFPPESLVNQAELFPSAQGKWRYDSLLRKRMSQLVLEEFRKHSPAWRVFLCMETPETWAASFGSTPMQNAELKDLFRPLPRPVARAASDSSQEVSNQKPSSQGASLA
ncbi:MAG: spore photoproduct lyase family protein [Bdellovibrio sp.]